MGRTSLKNKLILSFLALLLIVLVVVGIVNRVTDDFYMAQAVSAALALAAGIIFGSLFSKSLVHRLSSLSNVAREISRGDLSRDIPLLSRDEVRDLEEIFSVMVKELRRVILEMQAVSGQIQNTSRRLFTLARKVLGNSREIDRTARRIAEGSENQTLIVQKTALSLDSGLNEMDEMVRQSAETAEKANEARLRTEKGEAKAREILRHLDGVLEQMVAYTRPVFQLAAKVEKIKLVINVIDDIAQKTDLLSLNASIEATRAGAMGKGFALVADEIRSMAENSKRSSQDIRNMIEDILDDNTAVTTALKRSQKGIDRGRKTIDSLVNTFSETVAGVKEISQAIEEVEKETGRQVRHLRGLLSHFQELSRLANENFVSTQKTTIATRNQEQDMVKIVSAMKSLSALSKRMMETQRRFKLDTGES